MFSLISAFTNFFTPAPQAVRHEPATDTSLPEYEIQDGILMPKNDAAREATGKAFEEKISDDLLTEIFSKLITPNHAEEGYNTCRKLRTVCRRFNRVIPTVFSYNASYIAPIALNQFYVHKIVRIVPNAVCMKIPPYLLSIPFFRDMKEKSSSEHPSFTGALQRTLSHELTPQKIHIMLQFLDGKTYRDCIYPPRLQDKELAPVFSDPKTAFAFLAVAPQLRKRFLMIKNFSNPSWVLAAVRASGKLLQWTSKDLQNNPEIVSAAVSQDGLALQFASSEMQDNAEIVAQAVRQNPASIRFASVRLQQQPR